MINETRSYLVEIERFIQQSHALGAIESCLVEHALVKIYSAFESEVCNALVERCTSSDDLARDQCVASVVKRNVRSIRINELTGILGGFSEHHKQSYSSKIEQYPAAKIAYDNIMANRHAVLWQTDTPLHTADLARPPGTTFTSGGTMPCRSSQSFVLLLSHKLNIQAAEIKED